MGFLMYITNDFSSDILFKEAGSTNGLPNELTEKFHPSARAIRVFFSFHERGADSALPYVPQPASCRQTRLQ